MNVQTRISPAVPLTLAFVSTMCIACGAFGQTVRYVDSTAPIGGNGQSWETAYRFLSDALNAAANAPGSDEIRCADGVQRPDQSEAFPPGTGISSASFAMPADVTVLGGYAGIGARNPDLRDPAVYVTTLSGEFGSPDVPTDNAVVVASIISGTVVIDGLTITEASGLDASGLTISGGTFTIREVRFASNVSMLSSLGSTGGAVRLTSGFGQFEQCTFENNHARNGGAVSYTFGNATFVDCAFVGNSAHPAPSIGGGIGGAMHASAPNLTLTRCTFEGNVAFGGGALALTGASNAHAKIDDCTFTGNLANVPTVGGGATGGGGAIFSTIYDLTVRRSRFIANSTSYTGGALIVTFAGVRNKISDSLFVANTATFEGGAIRMFNDSNISARGCTFVNNSAPHGATIRFGQPRSLLVGCIVRGDGPLFATLGNQKPYLAYCNISGGFEGFKNSSDDPQFVDPAAGNFRLLPSSNCINRGPYGSAAQHVSAFDLDGNARLMNCRLDMGCFESAADGPDCNSNGVGDGCDELAGLLEDCDDDGLLNGCLRDADCDVNGIVDLCEVSPTARRATGLLLPAIQSAPSIETLYAVRPAVSDVNVTFMAAGSTNPQGIYLDGQWMDVSWSGGDGPNGELSVLVGVLPKAVFNSAAEDGSIEVALQALSANPPLPFGELLAHVRFTYDVATVPDCNDNLVPDECDVGTTEADCDDNGVPDVCDIGGPFAFMSPVYTPLSTAENVFTVPSIPANTTPVVISVSAQGDISSCSEHVEVRVNGALVGTLLGCGFTDCATLPADDSLVVPQNLWPRVGTSATISLKAVGPVSSTQCLESFIQATVSYNASTTEDANGDGLIDACCAPDLSGDRTVGAADLAILLGLWGTGDAAADFNRDGIVGSADLAMLLGAWGSCP